MKKSSLFVAVMLASAAFSTVNAQEKVIELPNRVKLEFVETGKSNGVPVIFLHGITDSWQSFKLVLPHLPKSIHAYAITLRGHGDSDKPPAGYQPEDFANDIASFMDAEKISEAYIVGHSMGSTIAQRFLLSYPGKVKGVVLIGAFAGYPGNVPISEFYQAVINLEDPIDQSFANDFQLSTTASPVPASYFNTMVGESLKVPAFVWRAALEGLISVNYTEQLAAVTKRVTIFWGAEDGFCPRSDQDKLLAAISGSSLIVYEGTGHALHWEEPRRFANDLVAFIGDADK
jgi:pimeloyl-ACP methyl ester carboxylesterase